MTTVFISYSRKDQAFAKRLTDRLEQNKMDFWIDWIGIPPSVAWLKEIEKGIEEAEIFLFLLSPDSVISKPCKDEIDHAVKNGKKLLPIVVRDVNTRDVPAKLSELNWIFFRETDDFEKAFTLLNTAIHTDYDWIKAHTRLQVRALEWEKAEKDRSFLLHGKDFQVAEKQLKDNTGKQPIPTALQNEYIAESRKAEQEQTSQRLKTRNRTRLLTASILIAVIVAIGLGIRALSAVSGEQDAAATAAAARTLEAMQAATADAANTQAAESGAQALANLQQANTQEKIALARRLGTESQNVFSLETDKQILSGLLAITSMQILPNPDALKTLQSITAAQPLLKLGSERTITAMVFSPNVADTPYLVAGAEDGRVGMWDTTTGKQVYLFQNDLRIMALDFDGRHIVFGDGKGKIQVLDPLNSQEVVQMQQPSPIRSVSILRGGQYVLVHSGNVGESIGVWEIATGNQVSQFATEARVMTFAISSDGQRVATISNDCVVEGSGGCLQNAVQIWDLMTGAPVKQLVQAGIARYVVFSPSSENEILAVGSSDNNESDGVVHVWSTEDWTEYEPRLHDDSSESPAVAISRTGQIASSSGEDDSIRIWGSGADSIRIASDNRVVAFSEDGEYLITEGAQIVIFEAATGREIARVESGAPFATNLDTMDRTRNLIAAPCPDKESCAVRLWSFHNGPEVSRKTNLYEVTSLAISPDGNTAVTGGYYYSANIWDVLTGGRIDETDFQDGVGSVAFSPDGAYIATAGLDSTVGIWNSTNGDSVMRMYHDGPVTSVNFSPDGKYVVSGSDDGTVRVWETLTGTEIASTGEYYGNKSLDISSDGKYIVSARSDNTAVIWDLNTGQESITIGEEGEGTITSLRFSPDGRLVVAGSADTTARVWETQSGNRVHEVQFNDVVLAVAFSPDGKWVAGASADGTARVWDAATGDEVSRMYHDDAVTIICFSQDGKYVMSASDDRTVRVWDAATGNEVARMTHDAPVTAAIFSPDDRYVFSSGLGNASMTSDGVRIWYWRPEDLIADVCLRMPRSLTEQEWQQYLPSTPYVSSVCSVPQPTATPRR